MTSFKSIIMVALLAVGLAGCTTAMADHDKSAMSKREHQIRTVHWIGEDGDEDVNYEFKFLSDGSDKPFVITTDDPNSPEFKEAMAKLKAQGIDIDLDMDHLKFVHLEHVEEMEGLHVEMKKLHLELKELEGLSEGAVIDKLKALEGIKGFEMDHKVFIEIKDGDHKVIDLKDGEHEWISEDGELHIIKKHLGGDVVILKSSEHGESHKYMKLGDMDENVRVIIIKDGESEAHRKVKVTKSGEKKIEILESDEEEDLK